MIQEIARKINLVSDEIIDEYFEDHMKIYENDNERKKEFYKFISLKQKRWSRQQSCIVEGCCEQSIKRSHTIQKSGPIVSVSRNSLVYTPEQDYKTGQLCIKAKGINEASTFPGFCSEHERIFSCFEEDKNLFSEEAITLQLYRTVCRELFRLNVEREVHQKQMDDYISFRDKKFLFMTKERLTDKWLKDNDVNLTSISFREDSILSMFDKNIQEITETYDVIKSQHLAQLTEAIKSNKEKSLSASLIMVHGLIPVTMSGFGAFHVSLDRRVLVFIGVYPNIDKNETCVVLFSSDEDKDYFNAYLSQFTHNIDLLNIVETFMIRGTDHWFIHPQFWDDMSDQKQQKILSETLIRGKGIDFPLDFSIFDSLRSEMVKHANPTGLTPKEQDKLELEKGKLNNLLNSDC